MVECSTPQHCLNMVIIKVPYDMLRVLTFPFWTYPVRKSIVLFCLGISLLRGFESKIRYLPLFEYLLRKIRVRVCIVSYKNVRNLGYLPLEGLLRKLGEEKQFYLIS